jgi:ATP-dependent protease ClpP protease subunit
MESAYVEAKRLKLEADTEKSKAETAKAKAEARRVTAEARSYECRAKEAAIRLEQVQEIRDAELVNDYNRRVYRFTGSVNAVQVGTCMATLEEWARLDEGLKDLSYEVVFTSPGGDVLHGMALFDFLRSLSRRGITVVTTDLGFSASMAGILLQAGDVRRMGKESYFHIHEISFGAIGKLAEVEDEVEFTKKITKRVVDIFVSRSGGKITERKLRNMFERKEAWFSSDEALKYGLVDEVL